MLFNSFEFLLFLPCIFVLYWLVCRTCQARNVLMLVAGYVFYAWFDWRFLSLIVSATVVGFVAGRAMAFYGPYSKPSRRITTLVCLFCLVLLGIFKYFNFFQSAVAAALSVFGFRYTPLFWHIALPAGISFYLFQILAYVFDVYRGRIAACRDGIRYAAFISFFPQLLAGPIERASDLLPQFAEKRPFDYALAVDGLRQMLWGYVKKCLIGDRCAVLVDAVYANPSSDGTDLWMGTVLFAFQIYGDFSGYSDIAIGCAKLFNIRLSKNFATPYFSRNVAEFWRRWHMTLMSWFRDYLYIPCGGSRRGRARHLLNILLVFLLSGLWHGANLTFVTWGAYHAMLFIPLVLLGRSKRYVSKGVASGRLLPSLREAMQMLSTFVLVTLGWVFFRSESITRAFDVLYRMFFDLHLHVPYGGRGALLLPLLLLLVEWVKRESPHPAALCCHGALAYRPFRWALYYGLILCILMYGGTPVRFIYFQF